MALFYNSTRWGLNATLDNLDWKQITRSDAIALYKELVSGYANFGIEWYYNNFPFAEWDDPGVFLQPWEAPGLDPAKMNEGIPDTLAESQFGAAGSIISSNIGSILLEHTRKYLKIRKITAKLNVTGDGGNVGSRPTAGIIFNETKKASLNMGAQLDILASTYGPDPFGFYVPQGFVDATGLYDGDRIDNDNIVRFIQRLQAKYIGARDLIPYTRQVDVCHASCHSSCHGSRGRR